MMDATIALECALNYNYDLQFLFGSLVYLMIYWQILAFNALESHLESFRQFLIRQKDIGYHAELYMGLIRAMKRVLRTNLSDRNQKAKLIGEIRMLPSFAEKDWLLERIQN